MASGPLQSTGAVKSTVLSKKMAHSVLIPVVFAPLPQQ